VHDDTRPRSIELDDRIVDEIDECFLELAGDAASELDWKLAADEGDAGGEDLVESFLEALSFELG
jgi:hypothetical protein